MVLPTDRVGGLKWVSSPQIFQWTQWTTCPHTYPIYNQGCNPLTIRGMNHQVFTIVCNWCFDSMNWCLSLKTPRPFFAVAGAGAPSCLLLQESWSPSWTHWQTDRVDISTGNGAETWSTCGCCTSHSDLHMSLGRVVAWNNTGEIMGNFQEL